MADKITQTKVLSMELGFYDGDTRTITQDNPKDNLTVADLKAFAQVAKTTQAVIGDKNSAAFVGLNAAEILSKKVTQLDLR